MWAVFKMEHFKVLANLNLSIMDKNAFTKENLKITNLTAKADLHSQLAHTTMENFQLVGIKGSEHFKTKMPHVFSKAQSQVNP